MASSTNEWATFQKVYADPLTLVTSHSVPPDECQADEFEDHILRGNSVLGGSYSFSRDVVVVAPPESEVLIRDIFVRTLP